MLRILHENKNQGDVQDEKRDSKSAVAFHVDGQDLERKDSLRHHQHSFLLLCKSLKQLGRSTTEIFGRCQGLICSENSKSIVSVEIPSKQEQECYNHFQLLFPAHVEKIRYIGLNMKSKI